MHQSVQLLLLCTLQCLAESAARLLLSLLICLQTGSLHSGQMQMKVQSACLVQLVTFHMIHKASALQVGRIELDGSPNSNFSDCTQGFEWKNEGTALNPRWGYITNYMWDGITLQVLHVTSPQLI